MNSQHDPLDRLLRSAAAAPKRETGTAAFPLEARVLAAWRTAARPGNGDSFVLWLRRAAICACLLALMSLAWTLHEPNVAGQGGAELQVADAAMRIGVEP